MKVLLLKSIDRLFSKIFRKRIKLMKTHTKEAGGGVIYALEELMLQNAL